MAQSFAAHSGEGGVLYSVVSQLAVNFVGDDEYVVAPADVGNAEQLGGAPDVARWIVRIAQHEHLGRGVGGACLEVVEVEAVAVVGVHCQSVGR